jgi:hypothetical protein
MSDDPIYLKSHPLVKLDVPDSPARIPLFLLSQADIARLVEPAGLITDPARFLSDVTRDKDGNPIVSPATLNRHWDGQPTKQSTAPKIRRAEELFRAITRASDHPPLPEEWDSIVPGCSRDWAEFAHHSSRALPRLRREMTKLALMEGRLLREYSKVGDTQKTSLEPLLLSELGRLLCEELFESAIEGLPSRPVKGQSAGAEWSTERWFTLWLWHGRIGAILRILAAAELDWIAIDPNLPISFEAYLPQWDEKSGTEVLPVGRYLGDLMRRASLDGWKQLAKYTGTGDHDHLYRRLKRWRIGEIIPTRANIQTLLVNLNCRKVSRTEADAAHMSSDHICFTVAVLLQGLLGAARKALKPLPAHHVIGIFQTFFRHRRELACA